MECEHEKAMRTAAAIRGEIESLRLEVIDLCWIATPSGYDESGAILTYAIPAGRMHRFIAAAQSAGIPAAFRSAAFTEGGAR